MDHSAHTLHFELLVLFKPFFFLSDFLGTLGFCLLQLNPELGNLLAHLLLLYAVRRNFFTFGDRLLTIVDTLIVLVLC